MATELPVSPQPFVPDRMFRAVSTLLAVFGVILVFYGLTLPLFMPMNSLQEAPFLSIRGLWATLLRLGVGVSLFVGARGLRRGRRDAAVLTVLSLIVVVTNALVVRGWTGLYIALIAAVLAAPLITRWRTLT